MSIVQENTQAVALFGTFGWIWNIVKILGSDHNTITGLFDIRVGGIFVPPLGAIVGYL